jgi:hypothetical protein
MVINMIVLATMHDDKYKELADETWEGNKVQYAEKHGYAYLAKTEDFYGFEPGFEKIQFILDSFEAYPDITWLWWTGTDSLVTNFTTRIEDKIAEVERLGFPNVSVIMSSDFNFDINCDSILIKNTDRARVWLQSIMDNMPKYASHQFKEQQCMLDIMEQYDDDVMIMPQHFMNSYEYKMYEVAPWNYKEKVDVNGERGQWESGDWFVHWPGTQPNERKKLVQEYKERIIK